MEKQVSTARVLQYIKQNWFQLSLLVLILVVFLRKDFSFSINLNSPEEPRKEERSNHPSPAQKAKKEPLLTEKVAKTTPKKSSTSILDRFELPFIGSGQTSTKKSELAQVAESVKIAYIKRFAHVAQSEQKKFGIPASIILANALHHSFAGQRDMAIRGNNHFAIPCTIDWVAANGNYQDACYRHYENAWMSFRDHSMYLQNEPFSDLFKLGAKDYKAWARGLEARKFSDFKYLSKSLLHLIEQYELYRFDQ